MVACGPIVLTFVDIQITYNFGEACNITKKDKTKLLLAWLRQTLTDPIY